MIFTSRCASVLLMVAFVALASWACDSASPGQSCTYEGETYLSGDRFPAQDGCNSCFCEDGSVGCTEMGCDPADASDASDASDATDATDASDTIEPTPETDAADPSDESDAPDLSDSGDDPDATDPVADCEVNGVIYEVGESFPAADGCNTCFCDEAGAIACTEMGCTDCYAATSESGCDSIADCRWLTEGCAEGDEMAIPTGCYPQSDCESDLDCPDGRTCADVVYHPCPVGPDGLACDACGGYIQACVEGVEEPECELECEFGLKTDSSGHQYCECLESDACIMVLPAPHRDPNSEECVEFPTVCDIPTGWVECDMLN